MRFSPNPTRPGPYRVDPTAVPDPRRRPAGPGSGKVNEQAIKAARAAGLSALDAYQAALESVVDAEEKLAEGSHVDWFTTLVSTQAGFTQRLGTIFLTSARDQLK